MLTDLTAGEIIHHLADRGVRVTRDSDDLIFRGNIKLLTGDEVAVLRRQKAALLAFITDEDAIDFDPDGNPRPLVRVVIDPRTGGVGAPFREMASEYISPDCDYWAWEGNPFISRRMEKP